MAWVTGYTYRQKITVAAQSHISGNLTDFPVAINIPSSNTDFWANDDGTGTYVRFALLDGTLLKFQVESYDAVGEDAWYHVKIPTLSSTVGTDIYVYYKHSTPTAGDDKQNTWDANFKGVWHLNQDQTEGAFDDATSNNNDGTNTGTTDGTGKIDRARDFNGVNQKIDCGTGASINPVLSDAFTIEAWVDTDSTTAHGNIASNDTAGGHGWNLYVNSGGFYRFILEQSGSVYKYSDTNSIGAGFEHVVGVWDGSSVLKTYRNGVDESSLGSSGTVTSITSTNPFLLGLRNNSTLDYNGRLDEVTFSKGVARSADWVVARYQSGLGTWLTFAAQETSTTGYTLTAGAGSYTLTGQTAGLLADRILSASAGSYTLTGQTAGTYYGRALQAGAGSYTVTGQAASLIKTFVLTSEAGSYVITGQDASLLMGRLLTAGAGSYVVTGQDVTLTISSAGAYVLSCGAGAYVVAGQVAGLLHDKSLTIAPGTYTVTGVSASLLRGYNVSAGVGSYTLTGTAASLTWSGTTAVTLQDVYDFLKKSLTLSQFIALK